MSQSTPFAVPEVKTRRERDLAARADAWNIQQSWIVDAPAGSGKTELLMQRFLRLLANVERPEEVLAITFTRKAAAEMRDRILESLRDAERGASLEAGADHKRDTRRFALEALETDKRMGWDLIAQSQRLNIKTIDSLCVEIASRVPIVSRLGAELRPIDDASNLYRDAARKTLEGMGGNDMRLRNAARTLLLHLDNRMDRAVELLANMLASRDRWGHNFPIDTNRSDAVLDDAIREQFENPLRLLATRTLNRAFQLLPEATWRRLFALGRYAAERLQQPLRKNIFHELIGSADLPERDAGQLAVWKSVVRLLLTDNGDLRSPDGVSVRIGFEPRVRETKELKLLLQSLAGEEELIATLSRVCALPAISYTGRQREILRASFLLLRRALAELRVTFAETGCADFAEFSIAARNALKDPSTGMAMALGTNILHLLVDEVQDTSAPQFDLLSSLVQGWDGSSQTVFLVGDPKQSIYRFRHVEVGAFVRACDEGLGGVHLHPIRLSSNFRSRKSLVQQTNEIFTRVFGEEADANGIRFTHADAAHREEVRQRVFWHARLRPHQAHGESASQDREELRATEARDVCNEIEHHRRKTPAGEKPASIAILVRARNHVLRILDEMRTRGIPYRAINLDTMLERQATLDLLAITRCILHPADRIAWLAVLRAPWCGLTLADLLMLCGNDDPQWKEHTAGELFRERLSMLSADGQIRAKRVTAIFESDRQHFSNDTIAMRVERIWRALGGPVCAPPEDLPGTGEFFRMLDQIENEAGLSNAAQVEERMRQLYAPSSASDDSPVEVLTLFKAKGLEWDVVLIPGLHRPPQIAEKKLLRWTEQMFGSHLSDAERDTTQSAIFLAPVEHVEENQESIGQWIDKKNRQDDAMELKRLLYVGCTRARRELHLFGECKGAKPKEDNSTTGQLLQPRPQSLLHTAWPFAKEIFEAQLNQPQKQSPGVAEMPVAGRLEPDGILESVAAGGENSGDISHQAAIRLSNFRRLPANWEPRRPLPDILFASGPEWADNTENEDDGTVPAFTRPQGSWRARGFGTALHALMEPLANFLADNEDDADRVEGIERMAASAGLQLLRAGFEPREAEVASRRIMKALQQVATDRFGCWILERHSRGPIEENDANLSGFEIPLTAVHGNAMRSIRVDRMFIAGDVPLEAGTDCLWIVDFKTASHGERQLDEFLAAEKEQYAGQMKVYAEVIRATYPAFCKVHVGLYYPLLTRFEWWPANQE